MSQSPETFFWGLLLVVVVAGSLAFAGHRLRVVLLPDWSGSPAVLAASVLTLSITCLVATVLGAVSLLEPFPFVLASLLVLVAALLVPAWRAASGGPPAAVRVTTPAGLVATAFVFLTVAQWGSFGSLSLDFGITNFDSVWYHLPFSAEFARTGSILGSFRPETVFLARFYPMNSELLHAIGMSLTGRDFLSPFLNYGWLALGLLSAWVAGRPYDRSHLAVGGAAVVFAAHMLVVREPGTAKNDIVVVALVLAAVAILVVSSGGGSGRGRLEAKSPLLIAGLALGLAAGTKIPALPVAGLVAVAAVLAVPAGSRGRAILLLGSGSLIAGGAWYLRNLLETGNPLPQLLEIGPIRIGGPERLQEARPDFSVTDYLFDGTVWSDYFLPGLDRALGPLWPVLLALFLVGILMVALRGPGSTTRLLALAALGSAIAYLFTPLTAAGPEGAPTAFAINLRFVAPALAIGLVLLPSLALFDRKGPKAGLLVLLVALFLFGTRMDSVLFESGRLFGLALAVVVVILPALAWRYRDAVTSALRGRSPGLVLGPVSVLLLAALAWPLADRYFANRYADFEPELGMAAPYRWANGTSGERIALAGTTAGFRGYGFFGPELDNEVRYAGRAAPRGGFDAIQGCRAFRAEVNGIAPDYLVTSPFLDFDRPEVPGPSNELLWIRGESSLRRVAGGPRVTVWAVEGRLDPDGCRPGLPGRSDTPGLIGR